MNGLRLLLCLLMLTVPCVAETAFVPEYTGGNLIVDIDLVTQGQDVILPATGWVMDIAVDTTAEKLYWVEGSMEIMRSNLDGSAPESVVSGFWFGVGQTGLAIDAPGGHLYWNDDTTLWRSNLDGSNLVIIHTPWQVTLTGGLDLDVAAGKVYYSGLPISPPIDPIYRCNLYGGPEEVVWDHPTILVGNLALDNTNDNIYFSDTRGTGIYRVTKSGAGLTLIHPSADVCGISVDPATNTVYWADASSRGIWRSDLDGNNPVRILHTTPASPTSLVTVDLPSPPVPVICGDCSGNGVGPDIVDALVTAQMAASISVPGAVQEACDVNSSGQVEILDALLVAQSAAHLQITLSCP